MGAHEVRIGIRGRVSDATARSLGGRIEHTRDGFELVVPYVDVAQVTGLLVRLGDLHIPFHHAVVTSNTDPSNTDPSNTDTSNTDTTNTGATS